MRGTLQRDASAQIFFVETSLLIGSWKLGTVPDKINVREMSFVWLATNLDYHMDYWIKLMLHNYMELTLLNAS